jgi:iron complex outermembrane receptor protein
LKNNPERLQTSLFFIQNIKLLKNKRLSLFPSVRLDYFSDTKISNLSLKFGLNYQIIDKKEIYLKSNIGNNFRVPTFNELYWIPGGNESLSQEKSINFDIGIISGFKLYAENIFEVTYSFNNLIDKIIWKPGINSSIWSPINVGKSRIQTLNAELKSKKILSKKLKLNADIILNYNRSLNDVSVGNENIVKQQIYIPEFVFKINSGMQYQKFSLNFFYQFITKRYTDIDNYYSLPAIDLVDANVGYEFKIKKLDFLLRFEANNIFNKNYQFVSGYPMPLRNYKIGLQILY